MSKKRQSAYYSEPGREDRPDYRYQRCPTSPPYAESHASQSLSRRSSIFSDLITVFRKNTSSHLYHPAPNAQKKSSAATLEQGLLESNAATPAKTKSKRFLKFKMNIF